MAGWLGPGDDEARVSGYPGRPGPGADTDLGWEGFEASLGLVDIQQAQAHVLWTMRGEAELVRGEAELVRGVAAGAREMGRREVEFILQAARRKATRLASYLAGCFLLRDEFQWFLTAFSVLCMWREEEHET